ncbi:peptidase domain-containing ABC transporter [Xanthocytophaga agilis]|uniref:ATP-binding cassette domain-containing protein n=1 Tax=Xanthocytophaga agilis TaxID=3048010 RepID=A0AAE3R448_9BACT|nr:ATP-binding cassette domain-containing protein [Xanthocytophaga agilis]MDJ1501039.1 ATP-binding cassette domain-containing protein [Xanthocytophaga agilis]
MDKRKITKLLQKIAELSGQKVTPMQLSGNDHQLDREYTIKDIHKFIDELTYKGQKAGLTFLQNHLRPEEVASFLENITFPVIFFQQVSPDKIEPLLIYRDKNDDLVGEYPDSETVFKESQIRDLSRQFLTQQQATDPRQNGHVIFVTSFPVHYLADQPTGDENKETIAPPTPLKRLLNLLGSERKDISYIYVYAIVVGLISLVLPLGIQAMIRLISGGMIFSSVVVIITVVIIGLLASGGLQIMQISLVEILQQRIFAKAAFEFTYRVPKIRLDALSKYYPPELMNRFFDVINVQKSLPKLLVDLTGAVLQILFGLILLSFYHPFFLAFSVLLVGIIALIFKITGPNGLKTSLTESKYKYKIVYWLEEIARTVNSFRLAGDTNLHMQKMDDYVSNYLYYRKSHFSVLRTQLIYIVIFKVLIIGGLLILGTLLVVDRQITLGQFVASEIVIVLVVAAVEKIIVNMDTVYDLLTAVEKIGTVTDMPLENERGAPLELNTNSQGMEVAIKDLRYQYAMGDKALEGVSFTIKAGEKVAIAGMHAAGKHTLAKLLAGVMTDYTGSITYNQISLRDIHPSSLRPIVSNYLFEDAVFSGSILENVAMNRPGISYEDVRWALTNVGLQHYMNKLPEGLYTHIGADGQHPSEGVTHKILFARAIVSKPKLLVVKDTLPEMCRTDRTQLIQFMTSREMPWTLVVVSNDAMLLSQCDKVLVFDDGHLVTQGSYQQVKDHPVLREAILQD